MDGSITRQHFASLLDCWGHWLLGKYVLASAQSLFDEFRHSVDRDDQIYSVHIRALQNVLVSFTFDTCTMFVLLIVNVDYAPNGNEKLDCVTSLL